MNIGRKPAAPWLLALAVVASAIGPAAAGASTVRAAILQAHGIGAAQFQMPKVATVAQLTALFGAPSARGVNTGCGPRYSEVEWRDLVAEFRLGKFSGYRFIEGGYPITTPGSPRETSRAKAVFPQLATARGISLGSTLAQLRAAYGVLHRVGADMWRSGNGLIFVDDGKRDPVPTTSHIVEIKIGTCGGF